MNEPRGHQDLWGDLFEIAVKRGVINYLLHRNLLPNTDPAAQPWLTYNVRDLRRHMEEQLAATDAHYLQRANSWLDHVLVYGYGLGWTCIREVLQRFDSSATNWNDMRDSRRPQFTALWCPLNLPDRRIDTTKSTTERIVDINTFWHALHLQGTPGSAWLGKGQPANADFLLLLHTPYKRYLLCLEFSLNALPHPEDFTDSETHLRELERYVRRIDKRGVFTRINAEVTGDNFAFDRGMASYISAFSGRDKPLYKLCQASSYVSKLAHKLRQDDPNQPVAVQAFAITQSGIEGLAALFDNANNDPRIHLLAALGETYRTRHPIDFGEPAQLIDELRGAFRRIKNALPRAFQQQLGEFLANPPLGEAIDKVITETVTEFQNPDSPMPLTEALNWVDEDQAITDWLGQPPRAAITQALQVLGKATVPCLRDLHAAAVQAGLNATKIGHLSILALEGHPGIGKTTAVKNWLHRQADGFLFIYMSPRIVINSKVLTELAEWQPTPDAPTQLSNILTLTSNQQFIERVWQRYGNQHTTAKPANYITGAVAYAGIEEGTFTHPNKGIRFLNLQEAEEVEHTYIGSNTRSVQVSGTHSEIKHRPTQGVWRTLGTAARDALGANPHLQRLALTTAIQGYRDLGGSKTTVEGLSTLFKYRHDQSQSRQERKSMAKRLPTIMVMLDEIAGDSAGALAAQDLSQWLEQQFIDPFRNVGEISPFRIILVIADASLGNAAVLQRHLEQPANTPDKILIFSSAGPRPFRLAVNKLHIKQTSFSTLHIMADGFPAASPLNIRYDLRLLPLQRTVPEPGQPITTPRQLIRRAVDEQQQQDVVKLIVQTLHETTGQVIFFAQDRAFLEDVATKLKNWARSANGKVPEHTIVTLHSGTETKRRNELIQPTVRDKLRVILMTSSGSRGISFPLATHIIASVPRFSVETGLMELVQLIYRGRGYYADPQQPGQYKSGDHAQRTLIFLLHDFVITDQETTSEEQQQQWSRQALDLLTFIVLLRATVFTRLTGDAGIPQQQLAVAPVGRISSDELETFIANQVSGLIAELKVVLADDVTSVNTKGRFESAIERIQRIFVNSRYRQWEISIAQESVARDFSYGLAANTEALAAVPVPVACLIPEHLYCVGPLWLERTDKVVAEELYEFDEMTAQQQYEMRQLLGQLAAMRSDKSLPKKLRGHAHELHEVLNKNSNPNHSEQKLWHHTTAKAVAPRRYWNCLPVDYPRFMPSSAGTLLDNTPPLDGDGWWNALRGALASTCSLNSVFPALPVYKAMPFLVIITSGDPTDLNRALDDRYFMASSEVNLLNALLFAGKS